MKYKTWVIVVKVISCCRLEAFIYLLTNSSATSLKQQARIQILPYIDIHNLILSQWLSKQSGGRHDSRGRHYSLGRHDFIKIALNIGTSLIVAQIKLLTKKHILSHSSLTVTSSSVFINTVNSHIFCGHQILWFFQKGQFFIST